MLEKTEVTSDLIQIGKEAGRKVLEIYNSDAENWDVSAKSDDSPLTKADKVANDYICEELKRLYPSIPIISEENKEIPYEERKNYEYFWLVDPLDGTKEFIKRNGEFTINIALIKHREAVSGLLYTPALGRMFYAEKNNGAFLWDEHGEKHNLSVDEFSKKAKNLRLVCSRSHMNEETQNFVDQYEDPQLVSMGSSLKFMLVAEGKADIYPRIGPTMEWDTGAAQAIVEEAGGKVLNYENGEPLVYNKEELNNPWFVVYGQVKD